MKKILMLGIAALMSVCIMAQNNRNADRQKMIQRQAENLSKDFGLKDEAKASFEALYTEYATELMGEAQAPRQNENEQAGNRRQNHDNMTAEQANERLQQMFDRQEKQIAEQQRRLEVQKKYCAEFRKTLTPQQVLRVMQPRQMRQGGNRQGGNRPGGMNGRSRGMGGFGGPQGGMGGDSFGDSDF